MSVSIDQSNGTYYVNVKPENVPKGNLGGAGIHQACATKEEAEAYAAQYKKMEEQDKAKQQSPIAQATPPQGVAAKLDKVA